MKKIAYLLSMVLLFSTFSSCFQDDIDDLNKKYDELYAEQQRQAELLQTYKALIDALENKLTITTIENVEDGFKIIFSDGQEMLVKNAKNGATPVVGENGNWWINGEDTGVIAKASDGKDAPSIISVVESGGSVIFYMSDGTTITMKKTNPLGLFVLSEGSMGKSNGQLLFYNYDASSDKYLVNENMRHKNYGETPNDLVLYGSKMYCAITGVDGKPGLLRVIDPKTGATIKDLVLNEPNKETADMPRRLLTHKGKVYVTLYSGAVAEVDTLSYATKVAKLSGTFSEGLCVYKESLYICNSGQGADNTISVVELASFAEKDKITVPYNPVSIVHAGNNELYFNTASVHNGPAKGAPSNLHVLNPQTKKVSHTFNMTADGFAIGKDYVYSVSLDWATYKETFKKIALKDKSVTDFMKSSISYMFPYKLFVDPLTNDVYATQMMGQDVYRFHEDGTLVETLKTKVQNGAAVVFVHSVH